MTIDTPHRRLELDDYPESFGSPFYEGFAADAEGKRVMSYATHDVVERVLGGWLKRPGVMSCKLDVGDGMLAVWLDSLIEGEELLASYRVPLREVVLAAAETAREYDADPSDISAMLRALADEIDKTP